jgi:hypothetical protein
MYTDFETAFSGLKKLETISPSADNLILTKAYENWEKALAK